MDDGYFPNDKIVSPLTLILGLNLVTSELSALKFPPYNKCHCIFNHHVLQIKVGSLRSNDADGNEYVKKTIGLISKTTTLHVHHAFLYISLPVFARLRREHA